MNFSGFLGLVSQWQPQLAMATLQTVEMAGLSFILAAVLGLGVAFARISKNQTLAHAAWVFTEIIRGTPILVQLFVIYFGLGGIGIPIPAFDAAVAGLAINYAAYLGEVYRAGIESIDRGQREAAQSIGMEYWLTMRLIILPQALRVVLPPMTNYLIFILQDTSVASLISAPELMLRTRDLSSEYFTPFELYLTAGAIYFTLGYSLSLLVQLIEKQFSSARRTPAFILH